MKDANRAVVSRPQQCRCPGRGGWRDAGGSGGEAGTGVARVIPPRRGPESSQRQASRSATRPVGCASFFSKTGAKTAKVAALAAAWVLLLGSDRRLRSGEICGESWRAEPALSLSKGVPAPHGPAPHCHTVLTSCGEMSAERRWTPSARAASATSVRELIRRAVLSSRFSVLSSRRGF